MNDGTITFMGKSFWDSQKKNDGTITFMGKSFWDEFEILKRTYGLFTGKETDVTKN